ncbi:hypothetical protein EG68_03069 [Paragonimus skrjabini miyazakii]|uniref:Uncharacterized protein n=1 Tax=Paragonimus skrjabini miyazakii TaxID=59628 RepID=A0A8S9Z3Q7_9TREM|nr:hypothetical protein EG68_03069 [Paragonimus skrjabini miyazakii]
MNTALCLCVFGLIMVIIHCTDSEKQLDIRTRWGKIVVQMLKVHDQLDPIIQDFGMDKFRDMIAGFVGQDGPGEEFLPKLEEYAHCKTRRLNTDSPVVNQLSTTEDSKIIRDNVSLDQAVKRLEWSLMIFDSINNFTSMMIVITLS